MNSPETPFQCLCPLGRGSSDDNRVGTVDHRFDDNHVDSSTNISFSGNTDIKSDNLQHSRSSTTRRTAPSHFYHGDSAQQCIDECRQGFLQYVLPSSPSTPSGSTSLTVTCSQLSQNTAAQQSLWQLYWCDSVFCGVWIDDSGTIGQDPNVDLIINECQGLGYSSIYDPGPPPSGYYCNNLLAAGQSANPCRSRAASVTETTTLTVPSTKSTNAEPQILTQHLSEHLTTAPAPKQTVKSLPIGVSTGAAVATTDSSSTSSSHRTKETTGAGAVSGVSAGVEGAIFACIIIVVLLAAGFVLLCIRQRRKKMPGQAIQHRKGDEREGKANLSRHRSLHATKTSGKVGSINRLQYQSQMHNYPRSSQITADNDFPTPLISSANSCSSVRGVSLSTAGASSKSASPQKGGSSYYHASLQKTSPLLENSPRISWLRRILNFFSSLKRRDRSASPPLTSLSPPPSPTQMSARGRLHMEHDVESDGGSGIVDKNGNRVSAATSGSSYYGYYGYNGHFVPYYFPSSPICAPTTNKLEPRRERTPRARPSKQLESPQDSSAPKQQQRHDSHSSFNSQTADDGSTVMPMPPLPTLPISVFSSRGLGSSSIYTGTGHRNPPSSYGSYSNGTDASAAVPSGSLYGKAVTTDAIATMTPLPAKKPVTRTSPASPVRPKRPHELPLEINNLAMPYPPLPLLFRAKLASTGNDRSFSMPGRTGSTSSAGRRTVDKKNETHKPPVAYRRDMRNSAGVEGARTESVSAGPRVPPPVCELARSIRPPTLPVTQSTQWATAEARGDRSSASTESPDLPPLLMRDDDDDDEEYGESGDMYRTQSTSSQSSSTIATITSADRLSTIAIGPFAMLPANPTTASIPPRQPFYHGPRSTRVSVQTIWPMATAPSHDTRTKTTFI